MPNPPVAQLTSIDTVVQNLIRMSLYFVGIAFVIFVVRAGYSYLSSGGNKENIAKARSTLVMALFGLVIGLSGWIIISLFSRFLGIGGGFLQFGICITYNCQ
jgi:hypothetical protein